MEEEIKMDQEERAAYPELAPKYETIHTEKGPYKQFCGEFNQKTQTVEEEYGADEDWENLSEYSRDDKNVIQEDHLNRHEKALKETKEKNYTFNFRKSCKVAKKEAGE